MFHVLARGRSALAKSSTATPPSKILTMAPAAARKASSALPEGYREDTSKGPMLRFEESLPRLPVPSLEETSKRYLKSVKPILNESEFTATTKAVDEFTKPGSIGHELQKRLIARRDDPKHKNWIYEWWNDAAYLACRDPVVPYVSYFYSHRDDRRRRNPAKRAAALTSAALQFKKDVDNGTLEPEYMRKQPISMESYQWMFNACRIPSQPKDHPVKYDHNEHKYIVVVRKNQFYKVFHEVNGQPLNAAELEKQFSRIYHIAQKIPAVGALTSEKRDIWSSARSALLAAHPSNAAHLRTIEASSFLVCLDDAAPVTLEERAHQYWHGDGSNRWFDKPCHFIINENGTSGFLGEHSMMDGTTTHRLNDYANMLIFTNKLDLSDTSIRSDLPEPIALNFYLDETVKKEIHRAATDFDLVIGQHDLKVQAYQGYGKGLIKKFKCSPDAYVQMIIQLAYHKMYGISRPTYESAATRRFQQGRTETCRSVSEESVAFVNAMADPDVPPEECMKAFRTALDAHVKYVSDASNGRGVDRHLFGLKKCLKEGEELPELYKDRAYAYSGTWYLSTSQLSSEYFNGYGWSQVVDEGFGIAYMINENNIQFNIVSKGLGSDRMSFWLNEAANDIRDVLLPTLESPKAQLNALVSVLLRVLEYYQGIIILTTNRIKSLDAAVQSRIHLAVRFDELTQRQMQSIFKTILKKFDVEEHDIETITENFENYLGDSPRFKLNGREIRNVVFSAHAMALSEGKESIGWGHIRDVLRVTREFQDQLKAITDKVRYNREASKDPE